MITSLKHIIQNTWGDHTLSWAYKLNNVLMFFYKRGDILSLRFKNLLSIHITDGWHVRYSGVKQYICTGKKDQVSTRY
jgi:hypothetical protein